VPVPGKCGCGNDVLVGTRPVGPGRVAEKRGAGMASERLTRARRMVMREAQSMATAPYFFP